VEGLAFPAGCEQIARHENRDLHYRLHYYPLTSVRGAVFFILI
jgi:hypothetical protein